MWKRTEQPDPEQRWACGRKFTPYETFVNEEGDRLQVVIENGELVLGTCGHGNEAKVYGRYLNFPPEVGMGIWGYPTEPGTIEKQCRDEDKSRPCVEYYVEQDTPDDLIERVGQSYKCKPTNTFVHNKTGCRIQVVRDNDGIRFLDLQSNGMYAETAAVPSGILAIMGIVKQNPKLLWDVDVTPADLGGLATSKHKSLITALYEKWGDDDSRCGSLRAYNSAEDGNGRIEIVLRFPLAHPVPVKPIPPPRKGK